MDKFTGVKYVECLSSFIYIEDELVVIEGLPSCPGCGEVLTHIEELWSCPGCSTEWDGYSLVEALRNERAIAELYKEE